jgi:hypothetical protein
MNRYFTEGEIKIKTVSKHMKKCSTSLVNKEMLLKMRLQITN